MKGTYAITFYPRYPKHVLGESWPPAWRIASSPTEIWTADGGVDFHFGTREDCQIACDALNSMKLTEQEVEEMTDEEFRRITTENLRW